MIAVLACCLSLCLAPADVGRELIVNGGFELDANGDGFPDGYSGDRRLTHYLTEEGNRFVRFEAATPETAGARSVGQAPRLDPRWYKLLVSVKVRHRDLVRGAEGWHNARLAMSFHDAGGQQVGGWPSVMWWEGTSAEWRTYSKEFLIPEGAAELRITPAFFHCSGQVDYDDFSVKVIALRPRPEDAPLPAGVTADWSLATAWQSRAATGGRVCLNGLWRFFPQAVGGQWTTERPAEGTGWGWYKVPSTWPGNGLEAVKPLGPAIWEEWFGKQVIDQGWYERDVTVPAEWAGRRLYIEFDLPQTEATVYLDGRAVGAARWPAGRVELTGLIPPGQTKRLTVRVTTDPLEAERLVRMREDLVEQLKAVVRFKGLVGDVYLVAEPVGARLGRVQTRPSVRRRALGLAVELADVPAGGRYRLRAAASLGGRLAWSAEGPLFGAGDLTDGRYTCDLPWPDPQLWDFEQPRLYALTVTLAAADGTVVDERVTRFGFRELWLDGRELLLNGTPIRLRATVLQAPGRNECFSAEPVMRSMIRRLRAMGFNFLICGNYGFDPGGTTQFEELLRVCDEEGFAVSLSLPHALRGVGGVGQGLDDLWRTAARYIVDCAGDHPSVLTYAGNHNALGYAGDQNPLKIDGLHQQDPAKVSAYYLRNRERAAESEAFVRALDPTREVYHHQSGHMGAWHTVNIYLCWSPIQERSEWLEHWATRGVKPLFFVEWGPPHQASWGGHRKGPFIWRNNVNSEPLGIEYGAMLTGDAAYAPDPEMERYVDTYERVYARRQPFHISSVLGGLWNPANEKNNIELKTIYTDVVWPRLRTWGITAILPWDFDQVGYAVGQRQDILQPTDWSRLQRPGRAPDVLQATGSYWCSAWDQWRLSSWGESLTRWNQPVIAYLAGRPDRFTERGHNVSGGETLTKQAILVNDSRHPVSADFFWRLSLGRGPVAEGRGRLSAAAGQQARVPFAVPVPPEATGPLTLSLRVQGEGWEQVDSLTLHAVPRAAATLTRTAVFDPVGRTIAELERARVPVVPVTATADLTPYDALILGREAIGLTNPLPDLRPLLGRGGKVLVMEQTTAALTRRLGFRTNDPSLRNVFIRTPEHPVLTGLDNARLADWWGEATLLPPVMDLPQTELEDPTIDWLGFANTRVWRCGNWGNVASVIIEKPQRGDFTALVDGGFDLQYAPLLLQRLGGGQILWCQLDLTGRTEPDPAADRLWANLLRWCSTAEPPLAPPPAGYFGDEAGADLLRRLRVVTTPAELPTERQPLLIVGPGAAGRLAGRRTELAAAVEAGGTVVCLPQSEADLKALLPFAVTCATAARTVNPVPVGPLFTGLGPSDLHWRGRREVLLVGGPGQEPNVINAVAHGRGRFVFCQLLPTDWDWADDYRLYLKRTANRTATMLARLLANAGAGWADETLERLARPANLPVSFRGEWRIIQDVGGQLTVGELTDALPWRPIQVPGTFEAQIKDWADYNGVVWYRREFEWTGPTDQPVNLNLGGIDDEDWTYINGQLVGHIGKETHPDNYYNAPRRYTVPAGLLRRGANTIAIRVLDSYMTGGLGDGPLTLGLPPVWLDSYYLDPPAQLDDPYRYNRW